MTKRLQIAICGSAEASDPEVSRNAEVIGKLLAEAGHIVLTGATTGYPWHAAKAAQEAGGLSVGISPAKDREEHISVYSKPTDEFDVLMTTGIGFEARNVILVRAADAVIIIGGRIGTVQEFTIAYQSGKVIGILEHSGGNAALLPQIAVNSNRTGGYIITDIDPRELVKRVLKKSR